VSDVATIDTDTPETSRRRAWWAGVAAASVALGAGEVTAAIGGQSLLASVGAGFIETVGKYIAKPVIEVLGTADKPALIVGTVVLSLLIGGWAARASLARRWVGPATFAAFGILGAAAGVADPAADDTVAVISAVVAAIVGIAALLLLLVVVRTGSFPPRAEPSSSLADPELPGRRTGDRRAFVTWAAALGAFGAALAAGAVSLRRGGGAAETARTTVALPAVAEPVAVPAGLQAEGVSSFITPNDRFYRIDTALLTPQVDPTDWTMRITGMVDEPLELSYQDLLSMATTESAITIACVSNEVGGRLVGNALWQGVPLAELLDRAGVQQGATQIVGRSVDGFTVGFPTQAAFDGRQALVAVGMNGEPLPVEHGFPARLVVAGLYGYVSATKWLSEIELTTWDAFDAYWIPRGWSKEAPVKTQSRIDVPRARSEIDPGDRTIAGVAWAPERGIERVEVQVDDGPWRTAELGPAVDDTTWRQWALPWSSPPAGEHVIRVRATDGTGATQTSDEAKPAPDGATGWHTIDVTVLADPS
jgi:DMSO/TMAO reductase YedYZ molybdopterin-dependent catalytic subunit